ncbi:MAG: hypothetical protein SGARI_002875 [Bacillariaceae sp.]
MSTPNSTSSTANSSTGFNPRDPSNFLTSPPTVVVKVVGTARADINGLLGIVTSYNMERERYLLHVTSTQSTMALKKENLQKAGMFETYRSQWEQLKNDPRVREKVAHYLNYCQQQVHPYSLWHVVGAVFVVLVTMLFLFGFTKCLMMTSLLILLLIIVGPDLMRKSPWQVVVRNFPTRAKETLEQQLPFLRGRLTDRMALGLIMLVVAFCVQSLFVSSNKAPPTAAFPKAMSTAPTVPMTTSQTTTLPVLDKDAIEKYYKLGFEDALKEKEHGASIQEELNKLQSLEQSHRRASEETFATLSENLEDVDGSAYDYYPPQPPPPSSKSLFSRLINFSSMGSMMYIYRIVKEKGTDRTTNMFSVGQLAANLQHDTELWQQAMLVFSVYNLLRVLLSW